MIVEKFVKKEIANKGEKDKEKAQKSDGGHNAKAKSSLFGLVSPRRGMRERESSNGLFWRWFDEGGLLRTGWGVQG